MKKSSKRKKGAKAANGATRRGTPLGFPKHPILKCLRIPQAVLENNAGKECTDREATKFAGIGWSAQIAVEISSAIKYGFTRRIVRPQKPTDKVDDRRVTNAMASWTAWFTTLIQPLASLIQTGYAELPLATRRFSEPTTAASAHFTIIPLVSRVVQVTANSCTGAHGLRQNHVHRTRTLLYPLSSEWLRWNGTPIAWYTSCLAQTTIGIRPE